MARFPASAIECGVAKSGSPGPKSTTSTPCAINAVARFSTASVGDSCIAETRFVSRIEGRTVVVMCALPLSFRRLRESRSPRLTQSDPGRGSLPRPEHFQDLQQAPSGVDPDHLLAHGRNEELHRPETEEDQRLIKDERQIHEQEKSEEALQDRQQDLVALHLVEYQRPDLPRADHE